MENQRFRHIPDYLDFRDCTVEHGEMSNLILQTGIERVDSTTLPSSVDLRKWCSPIENQGRRIWN